MPNHHAFEVFLQENRIDTLFDEPLGPRTTLKVGGPARYFIRPRDAVELAEILRRIAENNIPFRLLGGGANLLVGDEGVECAVLHMKRFGRTEFVDGTVKAESGCSLPRLVRECARRGLAGLEKLAGIPGSVAGALAMNAGGREGSIGQVVRSVDVMDRGGNIRRLRGDEIEFRYRGSSLEGSIILGCQLKLEHAEPEDVWERYDTTLADKKATQPLGSLSAGCVFRNPPGGRAGRMIDEAGLKGARIGRARVSKKHANFILNEGGATASDILRLIELIRMRVQQHFGALLELEIKVW